MHRRSSWLTRTWLALLLLVPFGAGCDAGPASGGRGGGKTPTVPTATERSATERTSPEVARRPRVHNVAVPPGPRRAPVAVHRARAGKPMPKLRNAVVQATREARAEALAAKKATGLPAFTRPVADARPWTPPAKPAGPQPTVTAAPAAAPEPNPRHWHEPDVAAPVAAREEPGPLDGLDWHVPAALLAGALAAVLLGLRRP